MKPANFYFQSVLISISIIMGLAILIDSEVTLIGAVWLFVLGVLQVVHSFILGIVFRKNRMIITMLLLYWSISVADLLFLFSFKKAVAGDFLFHIAFLVIPLSLSLFFWFITFRFKKKKEMETAPALHL